MRHTKLAFLVGIFGIFSGLTTAQAQDHFLVNTAPSSVLKTGAKEVELNYANKNGGQLYFNGHYARTGFKIGMSDKLSIAYYLNASSESFVANGISPMDKKTRVFEALITDKTDFSFSISSKFKLLDAPSQPVGLAAEMTVTVGSNYFIYTPKLIVDKRIGNNYLAFNAAVSLQKTKHITSTPVSLGNYTNNAETTTLAKPQYTFSMAYLHFLKGKKMAFGLEMWTQSRQSASVGLEHIALFGGPAAHFNGKKWFVNVSASPQIANLYTTWIAPESLVLDAYQKFEFKTMVGFRF
jgi:hypothetical protein